MTDNNIWKWSAKKTANAVKNKMISATDSIKSSLKRLDEVNPSVNAVVVPLKDEALNKARQIDNNLRSFTLSFTLYK